MKPFIGITANTQDSKTTIHNDNYKSVSLCGGVPVILPNLTNEEEIELIADKVDGLLLSGGGDIDPTLFGEEPHINLGNIVPERDSFEISLIKKLLVQNKPILAICRGCQILNIAAGGDMYQDIYIQEKKELLQHSQNAPRLHGSHFVNLDESSLLYEVCQQKSFKVNSFHHQAVREMGADFKVSATSSDGIIEAVESEKHRFVLGLQWHPENLAVNDDQQSIEIFNSFVQACKTKEGEKIL